MKKGTVVDYRTTYQLVEMLQRQRNKAHQAAHAISDSTTMFDNINDFKGTAGTTHGGGAEDVTLCAAMNVLAKELKKDAVELSADCPTHIHNVAGDAQFLQTARLEVTDGSLPVRHPSGRARVEALLSTALKKAPLGDHVEVMPLPSFAVSEHSRSW